MSSFLPLFVPPPECLERTYVVAKTLRRRKETSVAILGQDVSFLFRPPTRQIGLRPVTEAARVNVFKGFGRRTDQLSLEADACLSCLGG